MMIEIAMTENSAGRHYTLSTEKQTMSISVCRFWVNVCAHNAAASLRRNLGGKVFHGADGLGQAAKAYKSGASKAMIEAVMQAERAIGAAATTTIAA